MMPEEVVKAMGGKRAPAAVKKPAVKKPAKAMKGPSGAAKPAPAAPSRAAKKGKAPAQPRPDRRLAGIRAAAGELSKALDSVEKARSSLEESLDRAASGNITRAQGALGALRRLSDAGPLLDVLRVERELALLVEDVGDLRRREGKGRKRDLLAVDEFLYDAASRLELASTSAAGTHLGLLSERLAGLETLRRSHQAAIAERFRQRLDRTRKVLEALPATCVRLDGKTLDGVSRELQSALGLCKAFPVGRLSGKPGDLYHIDGLIKRLDRRLSRVHSLLGRKKEPSGG